MWFIYRLQKCSGTTGNGHKVFTHIYYSALKALRRREDLYSHAAILRDEAEAEPQKWIKDDEHTKYLIIRRAENSKTGYTVNVREEVITPAFKISKIMLE